MRNEIYRWIELDFFSGDCVVFAGFPNGSGQKLQKLVFVNMFNAYGTAI